MSEFVFDRTAVQAFRFLRCEFAADSGEDTPPVERRATPFMG